MSDEHSIGPGIIGTVVGGLILAVIFAVFGKLPAIIGAIANWVSYAFGLLGTDFAVSMWLLGFVLSVAAISIKRRIDRWIGGPRELIEQTSTAESVDQVVQQLIETKEPEEEISVEPNEPELDEVQMESVGAEEYDDEEEEEEEEDWRSYTSDDILDIEWRWRWHGTSIDSLTAHCPDCDFELYAETSRIDATGIMTGEWLHGFRCEDEGCGWSVATPQQHETLDGLHDYVKKHIRREARRLGLDRDGSP